MGNTTGVRVGHRTGRGQAFALVLLCLLAGWRPLAAQTLQFRHLGPDDGFVLSYVQQIMQDDRGFMWFATANGLMRYDGYELKAFHHLRQDTNSIADRRVNAVYEDREGTIWAGTGTRLSLNRFDAGTEHFQHYALGYSVNVMLEDSAGTFWVGTIGSLMRFDRKTGEATRFSLPGDSGNVYVQMLFEDSRRHLWVGTRDRGLYELDPSRTRATRHRSAPGSAGALPDDEVRAMVEGPGGQLWLGTYNGGLVRLDPATGRSTRYAHDPEDPRSLSVNNILRLELDGKGGLWVGMENGGLDHFDPATGVFQHNRFDPNNPFGLSNNSVWSLYQDPSGTLWVGTFSGGVNISKHNSAAIQQYRSIPGDAGSLSSNSVLGFAEDLRGAIWIATDGGGVDRLDPATGRFTRYTTATSNLNQNAVLAVATDRTGGVWVGTWAGGISRLDPETGRFTAYTTQNSGLPDDHIFSLLEDRAGRLWVGTWKDGLVLFDRARDTFRAFATAGAGENQSQIWQIRELSDGRLALATLENGLVIFDPASNTTKSYRSDAVDDNTLSSNEVRAILETEPGILWVGTAEGLDRLDLNTNTVTHISEADGLPSSAISGLALDTRGLFWVSTELGIVHLDPASKRLEAYTTADGLQGAEFAPRAYFKARDGTLYFGGTNGFNAIRPDRIARNDHKPPVVLTGFQLFNKPVEIGASGSPLKRHISRTEEIRLSHGQNVFSFEFAALDYEAPGKNQYAYRLEGFDKDWHNVGTTRTAAYTGLPPGHYVFRVKASNNDGVWNEEGTSLRVVISPPFWQTWYFRLLVLLLLAYAVREILRRTRHRREALRQQKEYLEANVSDILTGMQRLSDGDLAVHLADGSDDEIGQLRRGFNTVVGDIRSMVMRVDEALHATVAASQEIQASTEEVARGAQRQTEQATEVAAAAEQMTATASETASHLSVVAEIAQRSGEEAVEGGRIARDTISGLQNIVTVVERSAEAVTALGSSSQEIGKITRVIDAIAAQTNLLALNAAIEAARAGEHGRGFAVVADEVRKLAERTTAATKEISRMVEQIQGETEEAVATMGQVSEQIATGNSLVSRGNAALAAIIENSQQVLDRVQQVAAAGQEHAATSQQIRENIESISEVSRDAANGNEAIARAAQELTRLVENLELQVRRFNLDEGAVAAARAAAPGERRPAGIAAD